MYLYIFIEFIEQTLLMLLFIILYLLKGIDETHPQVWGILAVTMWVS